MKFKVWNSKNKFFSSISFVISENGELGISGRYGFEKCPDHFIPVFSINEKDIYGVELSVGDKCKVWRYDSDCAQEVEILEKGIITGDFGEYRIWTVGFAMSADYQFEKIGSKYET